MKKKILFVITALAFVVAGFAQTKNATLKSKREDSLQLIKVKKEYPDNFRFNIVPIKLTDNSLYAPGFMSGIRLQNNIIADSIQRNYHADMPDTSSVIPYASLTVIGERVTLQYLQYGFFTSFNKAAKNSIEPITNTMGIEKVFLPKKEDEKFYLRKSIRISINGKLLFNWKKVADFKRQLCKVGSYESASSSMYAYEYVFSLCDTSLAINDQLFIEIKDDSTNQMMDSYNITRKAVAPKVSLFLSEKKDSSAVALTANEAGEKKNFTIDADVDEVIVKLTNNEFQERANVEYLFKKAGSKESTWQLVPENNSSFKLILNAGNNYDLFVRYPAQKETVEQYTIAVKPHFWQTAIFKIIIVLLMLCVAFYIYTQRKKIQHIKTEAAQKQGAFELKSIQAQLNPHFIFNALGSIQGLMNTGKIDEANQYLSEFSMLMRGTLNDNDKAFSTIESEIKKLEQYLNLEQLRFGFAYNICVAEDISRLIEIPTLLLQPIVENAIKHGVSSSPEGKIEIHFLKKADALLVTITDNGKGFNPKENTEGYGLKLTAGRIKLINSLHAVHFIEQKTTSDNNGTIVTIIFNEWL